MSLTPEDQEALNKFFAVVLCTAGVIFLLLCVPFFLVTLFHWLGVYVDYLKGR